MCHAHLFLSILGSYEIPIFEMSTEKSLVAPTVKRVVTEIDKQEMMTALQSEKDKLTFFEGGESVSGAETLHGFSDELIAGVIQNLSYIDSSKDICTLLPIFDIHHARIILELMNEFFNDVPNFDDQIEKLCDGETSVDQVDEFFKLLSVFSESDTELIANDIDDDGDDDNVDEDVAFDSALIKEFGLSL